MTDRQNKGTNIRQHNSPSFFDDDDDANNSVNSVINENKTYKGFEFIEINSNNSTTTGSKLPRALKKDPLHFHRFKVKNLASTNQDHTIQGWFCLYKGYIAYCNKVENTFQILSYLCIDLAILSPKIEDPDNGYNFTITKNRITYEFMTNHEFVIDDWLSSMKLMCIHYNFHEEFKAIKLIGKGSFARVYQAENSITKIQYAVKACSKEYLMQSTKNYAKATIINEICILRQLKHENIMKLYQVYETNNSLYMITELINGKTLEDLLFKIIKYDEIRYKKILKQILEALAYLSSKGIMHRDLKPDNILVDENDNIKIIDFGLSALTTTSDQLIFDKCGTPGYIAPEVFKYDVKNTKTYYDEKCDVFSAGCIFYYMLFGCKYIPGKKVSEILQANKDYKASSTSYQNLVNEYNNEKSKLNKEALHLLLKMIEVDPKKRISASMGLEHPYIGLKISSITSKKSLSENDIPMVHNLMIKSQKNTIPNSKSPIASGKMNFETKPCTKDILDTLKTAFENTHSTELKEKHKNSLGDSSKNKLFLYVNLEAYLLNGGTGAAGLNTFNSDQLSGSTSSTKDTPLNKKISSIKLTTPKNLHISNSSTNANNENNSTTIATSTTTNGNNYSNTDRIRKKYKDNNLEGTKTALLKNIQRNFDLIKIESANNNNDLIPNLGFSEYLEPINKYTIVEEDSDTVNTPPLAMTISPNKLRRMKSRYTEFKAQLVI